MEPVNACVKLKSTNPLAENYFPSAGFSSFKYSKGDLESSFLEKETLDFDLESPVFDFNNGYFNFKKEYLDIKRIVLNRENQNHIFKWLILNRKWIVLKVKKVILYQNWLVFNFKQLILNRKKVNNDFKEGISISVSSGSDRLKDCIGTEKSLRELIKQTSYRLNGFLRHWYGLSDRMIVERCLQWHDFFYFPIQTAKNYTMNRILYGFSPSSYSDAELLMKGSEVKTRMTDNPNFLTPSPALVDVEAARVLLIDAMDAAAGGLHEAVAIKNAKRKIFAGLLKDLAIYVNQTAKGDEAILLSSGFDLAKKAEPVGPLETPENLRVQGGKAKGTLKVTFSRVEGAKSYVIELRNLTLGADSESSFVFITKPSHLLTGLIRGNEYSVRAVAVGADPARNWSDFVSSFVS